MLDLQRRSHSGDGAPPSRARPARTISQRRRSSALLCSTCKDDLTAETELRPPVLDLQGRSHSGDGAPPSRARPARTISQRRRSSALPCSTCKDDLTAETELRPPVLDLQGRSHSGDGAPPSRARPARTISQRRRSSALPCSTCKDDLTAETELRPPVLDLQGRSHSGDGAPPSRARPARKISQRRRSSALPLFNFQPDGLDFGCVGIAAVWIKLHSQGIALLQALADFGPQPAVVQHPKVLIVQKSLSAHTR